MKWRVAAAAVVAAGATVAGVELASPSQTTPTTLETSFRSRALRDRLRLAVFLPRGYATSRLRYPVVYFLHGLPASSHGYRGAAFAARALAAVGGPAILVAPQGARESEPDPEYLDRGEGDEWESAIARELPEFVDTHYRTLRERTGRALIGFSAGGYGATLVAFHHLDEFAVIESWSGYFHPTNPAGTAPLDVGSPRARRRASAHTYVPRLRSAFREHPTFFAFYVGNSDTRFRQENLELHRELLGAGVVHLFRLYPGGHAHELWSSHAREWLRLALQHLAPARP